ncbi:MAG: YkvA family protein [Sphaerochaeta sp.]
MNDEEELKLDEHGRPLKMAEKLGEQVSDDDIKNVEEKLPSMNRGPIAKIWDKVIDIYNAFKSDETPNYMKVLLIGSLVYLVLPSDVIPDLLPGVGFLDDVGVLTFIWKKLKKLSKVSEVIEVNHKTQSITEKVQDKIKQGYEKAFELASVQLEKIIKTKARSTVYNSLVSLGLFVVGILMISNKSTTSVLLASILIWYLLIRSTVRFIRVLPVSLRFIKVWWMNKNLDVAISAYLKQTYTFIDKLEEMKNKIRVLDDVPDLEIIVKMQRKSLMKTIVTVILTVALLLILFFVMRHYLLFKTSYTYWSILAIPFKNIQSLIAG